MREVDFSFPLTALERSRWENRKERNMRLKFLLFIFFVAVYSPVIAVAQNASYNYARGVDLSQYKTYQWVDIAGAGVSDSFLDSEIKQAIDAQLTAKGLTKSNQGAQLYVAYQVSFPWEKQIEQYMRGGYGGYGPGWGYGCLYGATYGGPAMSLQTNSTIQFGNLVLDIYDSAFKLLMWRGNVSKAFRPDLNKHNLEKAVAKLLKSYPPKIKY
jgi:hypothetical protein